MSETIKLTSTAADGFQFSALHAQPEGKRLGGIVIIQEIFGLDEYVQADVERWAKLGFEALAPSMFDRYQVGFTAGHDEGGYKAGFAALNASNPEDALADLAACIAYLKDRGPVFMVGYCYGGAMTWQAAGRLEGLAAASSYYGGRVAESAALTPKCPIICHFGRKDEHIPADAVKAALASAQPQVPVYIYENSGHGFNNDGRPDSDLNDAKLARERTLALFQANGAV
jgi:carboxymethylenebutenolidase